MTEDSDLLRQYAESRSEAAFAELVRRHLGLVYGVALRQAGGDAALAEDVAQTVFAQVARKAAALARHPALSGWLHRSTRFTAIDVRRADCRRRAREQEAITMQEISSSPDPAIDSEKLRPVLDEVLGELADGDRDAVALRFFEGRAYAEVAVRLRLNEDAARRRVDRALEKLRVRLSRRGVTSTATALAAALGSQAATALPAGLASVVTGTALATGAGGGAAALTLMSLTKLQFGVIGALALAGAGGVALQHRQNAALAAELAVTLRQVGPASPEAALASLRDDNRRLTTLAAEADAGRADVLELSRLRDEAGSIAEQLRARAGAAPANAVGSAYPVSALDRPPTPTTQGAPAYPIEMRRAGITGTAVIAMTVDAQGNVTDPKVARATRPEFGTAALEAVKQWHFDPAQKNGSVVGTTLQVPIVFTLSKDNASPWF